MKITSEKILIARELRLPFAFDLLAEPCLVSLGGKFALQKLLRKAEPVRHGRINIKGVDL